MSKQCSDVLKTKGLTRRRFRLSPHTPARSLSPPMPTPFNSSMEAHPDDEDIQELGSNTLCSISDTEDSVRTIVQNGGVPIIIRNIETFPANIDLLKVSMMLLSNMLLISEGEVAVRDGKGVDAVVSSVMYHPNDDGVRKAAMELVELLSSDELVKQMIDGLKKFIAGEMAGEHPEYYFHFLIGSSSLAATAALFFAFANP